MASLLLAIDRVGSINQAAASLGMSYRQAWGHLKKAEQRLGMKLVETKIGGESGGGAKVTEEGRKMLLKYRILVRRVDECINAIFEETFGH